MTLRVALTGPDGDGGSLGRGLRALGAETLGHPLLQEGPAPGGRLARALEEGFDLMAFTSVRAVEAAATQGGARVRGTSCLVVGERTAVRARDLGFRVLAAGKGTGAAGLVAAAREGNVALTGKRVLFPASNLAGRVVQEGLRGLGATVVRVQAYVIRRAADPQARVRAILGARPDAVVLASPSAADALAEGLGETRDDLPPLVALGPTTEREMRRRGLPVAAVAASPTPEALRAAMGTVR